MNNVFTKSQLEKKDMISEKSHCHWAIPPKSIVFDVARDV